ncbi:MAG: hypothetical protein ACJ73D_06915 [Pyrinomonadaceae bacterium]
MKLLEFRPPDGKLAGLQDDSLYTVVFRGRTQRRPNVTNGGHALGGNKGKWYVDRRHLRHIALEGEQ